MDLQERSLINLHLLACLPNIRPRLPELAFSGLPTGIALSLSAAKEDIPFPWQWPAGRLSRSEQAAGENGDLSPPT